MMAGGGGVEQELPSAFRNVLTPVTDTGNETVDSGIAMLMNIPDLFVNTFDGVKGTSLKDKINLERGYPELVHEDSYQFNLENRYGRFDKYKDRLKKDGVPSKLYQEGGSVYSNPYFGDADPEEVKKLQEKMPGLSTEDAVAIILGIDTSDITKGFAKGGIARFNQGQTVGQIGGIIGGLNPNLMFGGGGDEYAKRENQVAAQARAEKIIADLRAEYGDKIPAYEIKKVKPLLDEANMYNKLIENIDVADYKEAVSLQEQFPELEVEINKPESVINQEKIDNEKQNEIAKAIAENNSPDFLAEEMRRYAGILGLPDEDERQRDKTTAMLLGLGSSISNATNLGDIGKSFPSIFNAMQGIDKQETKDKMGILNLLATQQKTNTLSRKDRLTIIQNRIEDLRKELEQPAITGGRTPEDIQKEIADLSAIINQATGVGPKAMTGGDILQAKKYVGG